MIRNGLLGEAQADGTMKMWLCSFHDFGLGTGRFLFLSKIRRQKWTRFESCMKEREPAQAPGITGRTVLASDVSRNPISYRKVWMCPLCWVSSQFHRVPKGDIHHSWRPVQPGGFRSALALTHCDDKHNLIPAQGPPVSFGHVFRPLEIHLLISLNGKSPRTVPDLYQKILSTY